MQAVRIARLALLSLAFAACSDPDAAPALDASADAPSQEAASPDAAAPDASLDVTAPLDASPDTAPPPDGAPPPPPDVPSPPDAPPPPPDGPAPLDAPPPLDVVPPRDAAPEAALDVPRPPDAAPDAAPDAPRPTDATCAAGFTVAITAPTANQMIETCTAGGMPVYFDFNAAPSAGATSVTFEFRTPAGTLAAPALPADTSAPFTVRRQVGGPMTAMVPLATFGLRGTWYLEVTARDSCGRTATARQPFLLTYTNRMCPNP